MSTELIQEVRKDTEEIIKSMGGSVDLSALTECMNYAQNFNTCKMISPMQELSKIEETFKSEEDSQDQLFVNIGV
jgi:hypothetical protein